MSALPQSTLVLLVTCSRDVSRRDLAIQVMRNLAEVVPAAGLSESFVVFDNASIFDEHLALAPASTIICRSAENIGYWSAVRWILDNRNSLLSRRLDHLYVVESDLWHSDLRALGACERFLKGTTTASGVRTQEFSVRARWRYDKRLHWLPFHVTRSEVALANAVTGEAAWFRPAAHMPGIYLSNLHPKLPALNRMAAVELAFRELALLDDFSEGDFFRSMLKQFPHIGVLDGGLFHSLASRDDRRRVATGSYSSAEDLEKCGYHATRKARFLAAGPVDVVRTV